VDWPPKPPTGPSRARGPHPSYAGPGPARVSRTAATTPACPRVRASPGAAAPTTSCHQ
jgi:hypothetical protein